MTTLLCAREIFVIDERRRFTIGTDPALVMGRYAQHKPTDTEGGGLLLGRFLSNGDGIVVDVVTEPNPLDSRGRFHFNRTDESNRLHAEVVDFHYEASRGTCGLLGTWHTHAEPDPEPSDIDLAEWKRHASEWTYDGDELFFAIVGTQSVGVWEVSRDGKVRKLTPAASGGGS